MSTLKANTILAASGLAADPVAIPGLDKRFATAWVNFNGLGTVAIRSAYNVASITDNTVGDYTVNFAVPMSNANYAEALSAGTVTGSNLFAYPAVTKTAAQLRLRVSTVSPALTDADLISALFFGGQA